MSKIIPVSIITATFASASLLIPGVRNFISSALGDSAAKTGGDMTDRLAKNGLVENEQGLLEVANPSGESAEPQEAVSEVFVGPIIHPIITHEQYDALKTDLIAMEEQLAATEDALMWTSESLEMLKQITKAHYMGDDDIFAYREKVEGFWSERVTEEPSEGKESGAER